VKLRLLLFASGLASNSVMKMEVISSSEISSSL
jgi:hypothetical protein